jgi:hypothetical protein
MDFYARGIQAFEQGRARTARNRLAELSSAALSAPVEQRGQFASQIAAIDPDAGFSFDQGIQRQQQAMQAESERRLGNMAKLLSVAPSEARGNLWSRIRPGLQQMGYEAPEAWDDSLLPVVQQLGGADQQGPMSAQREYVEWMASQIPEERRGEFMLTQAGLMPKVVNQQYSIEDVEMADGTVRRIQVPTRGGRVYGDTPTPPGTGSQPPARSSAQGMDGILAQANVLARQGVPDAQIEQFIAQAAQRQGVQMTPAGGMTPEMESAASATLDRQTFGAPAGEATNASRAAAAAEAAAAKVRAEEMARNEVEAGANVGKSELRLGQVENQYANISDAIDDALKLVNSRTTGFIGARTRNVEGTDAFDLGKAVLTVQANLGFDRLQEMRDSSPTGGALGQVAVQELEGLQATVAALDPNQSEEQLRAALQKVQGHYDRWYEATRRSVASQVERGRAARGDAPASNRPRAESADGRIVEWDGSAWVEVR